MLPALPPNCLLTVNLSPHLLTEPELAEPLLALDDLAPLVLELTEHQAVGDLRPLVDLRDRLRARGALLALDDAGSGYSGLQQITQFRPQPIKLDRALVTGVDGDEIKLPLVEMLGEFSGRIDAWLLAEGIETWGELQACLRLQVPLGQGWLLGRPGPPWVQLDPGVRDRLRRQAAQALLTDHVAGLAEPVMIVHDGAAPAGTVAVEVDQYGHPRWLLVPHRRAGDLPGHRRTPVSLRVPASAGLSEVAQRVAARSEETRFDPVVCVDANGAALGRPRGTTAPAAGRGAHRLTDPRRPPDDGLPTPVVHRTTVLHPPEVSLMKQFACGDVVPSCGRTFTAPTGDGILAAVAGHARDDHGLSDIPASLVDQVRAAIHTV